MDLVDVKGVVGFGDVREKMRDERERDVVGCERDGIGRMELRVVDRVREGSGVRGVDVEMFGDVGEEDKVVVFRRMGRIEEGVEVLKWVGGSEKGEDIEVR